ncbi:MAG TPA: phenylalanine--tRNA ligase subunit beta [Gemmatimonadaceae bacterium]|nr:phenylalanine--tRNA ligase subunit beta [Gemmatimonadaceae bacterium]
MNVSYEWLRALVPFDQTPAGLRDLLTARVATVDDLLPLRRDLAPIVVGLVVEEAPHPDSDHLHVTKVDDGSGVLLDVVCGAPNVTAGKRYPFARTGTTMPNGLLIERRKIRGQVSNGMLCSPDELLLGSDHSGIMELAVDAPPGTPLLSAVPVGDVQLVIDVGANRPDLLSHLGVAREIAAATHRPLDLPAVDGADVAVPAARAAVGAAGVAGNTPVRLGEPGLVRRFMGVVIRGVRVGPSPDWLVARLTAVGGRSINNVVDASNYVLHELGQPTHAFDLAKLSGGAVVVRRARDGERIVTLDGVERTLGPEMIVIADAERPQGVAGVMGGRDSEVSDATTDLFLEVANFNPGRIRLARRALALNTDASYRFERGVDVELAPRALERVAQLIVGLAGGKIDGQPIDLRETTGSPARIRLRPSRVAQLLGEAIPPAVISTLLESVGFTVDPAGGRSSGSAPEARSALRGSHRDQPTPPSNEAEGIDVVVPSWRGDVTQEVDLVEEVARLYGYDRFPDTLRPFRTGTAPDDPRWLTSTVVRDALVGAGLLETQPLPFVRVVNPIADSEAYLRREIIDTLARCAEHNLARMEGNLRLFDIGDVFSVGAALPHEELHVGALVMGRRLPPHFTDPKTDDFEHWATWNAVDVKALARETAERAYPGAEVRIEPDTEGGSGPGGASRVPTAGWEGRPLWRISVDGAVVGAVGQVRLDAPVWAKPAWGFELSLGVVESRAIAPPGSHAHGDHPVVNRIVTQYRPIPVTPAAVVDLALILPPGLGAARVEECIRRAAGDLLERLDLFDEYTGKGVEPGHRSVAWRLTFRDRERTLRDKEIEGRRSKILSALEHDLNVRPRTT